MAETGTGAGEPTEPTDTEPESAGNTTASRLWRSIWRTHFYAGLFAAPILVLLAVTGLVILYTEPIEQALDGDLVTVTVTAGDERVTFDDQRAAVADRYPDWDVVSVTPPKEPDRSTAFAMTDEDGSAVNVYVDPYTGEVLGRQNDGADIVGLANRLHGNLDNESVTVPVPSLAGIFGDGPAFADAAVGDMLVEVFAGWGLVLAFTGAYLWWPRKQGTGKALFVPRIRKPGRARWRDLHAVGGTVLAVMLVFFLTTGLPWSTGRDPIPPSGAGGGHHGGGETAAESTDASGPPADPVSLDTVVAAAEDEGMRPGYTVDMPVDVLDDPDAPVYGSYVVINPWPSRMQHQGALYLDQFSAKTLAESTPRTWGRLQWLTELGIQSHMGTQYGIFTRTLMTLACVLVLWNVTTAAIMWNNRRRKGTLGLPRRPADVRLQRILGITALVLAVVYPLWGLTLVAVLLVDRYVVRRVPKLRYAFGMR